MQAIELLYLLKPYAPHFVLRCLQLSNNCITQDADFMRTFWTLVGEKRLKVSIRESHNLYTYLRACLPLGGAIAEVGVYKGGSAKLLATWAQGTPFYLFDTFEGMPDTDARVDVHAKGDFSDTSLEGVQQYLAGFENLHFRPGRFPASAASLPDDLRFSFVNLDVDIYESTLEGLRYFFPRLVPGGVLISHDYNSITCPGVKKAFDEFTAGSDIVVTPLFDTQCMITKPR
jgi:O-methyltransferase